MRNIIVILTFLSILLVGCGSGKTVPKPVANIEGKVLLPKGKPLEGGRILLKAKGASGTVLADIDKDGSFEVDSNEVVLQGDYEVYLVFRYNSATERKLIRYVPAKYREIGEGDSDISVTLSEDNQNITVKLKA
jgi:hypothetical protein